MGKLNSKRKGKVGELELSNYLSDKGFESKRGVQYQGGEESPDVISTLPFHIECKRVEKLNLYEALEQAVKDSETSRGVTPGESLCEAGETICGGSGCKRKPPVVIHRRNRKPWVAVLLLDDLLELVKNAGRGKR